MIFEPNGERIELLIKRPVPTPGEVIEVGDRKARVTHVMDQVGVQGIPIVAAKTIR